MGIQYSGIVESLGQKVTDFHVGDKIYTRLPLSKIDAFAESMAADHQAARTCRYLDSKQENDWEVLSNLNYVIDTLGAGEFQRELSVLKLGGQLLILWIKKNECSQHAITSSLQNAPRSRP